jgi:xanthosine utilization system XapX-like protein
MGAGEHELGFALKAAIAITIAGLAYGLAFLMAHDRTRRGAEAFVAVVGLFGLVLGMFMLRHVSWGTDIISCWAFLFAGAIVLSPFVRLSRRKSRP